VKRKLQPILTMQFGFGAALAVLFVVGTVAYRSVVTSHESMRWTRHTHEVLEHIVDLRSAMESVDSGYRDFALSDDAAFLVSARAAIPRLHQELPVLRALTIDNPEQQRRIGILEGLAQQTILRGDRFVRLPQTNDRELAAEVIRKAQGDSLLETFRSVIGDMEGEEHRLLLVRSADEERRFRQAKAVVLLASAAGLLMAALAGWLVRRNLVARKRAEFAFRDSEERNRLRDITERRETEAKYRELLEAAPDAMVVVDQVGKIVLLNLQAEKQFGYRSDELVGQQVMNIIPEGFAERLIADGARSAVEALAQQIGTGIELQGRRKDGGDFPIEIMLSPLQGPAGILVTAAIRDISVRKRAEEHLVKTMGELKRSNDELSHFAYVASHDLQEPLRMVASYTQLLAKRYQGRLDTDADEFIAYAVDGCNRMQQMIQDLLAYSRAGTGGLKLREISSELALDAALLSLRAAIEESGAVVTHDSLPAVTTDDSQLSQVFQNLIGNAIKYRGTEVPRIHVSATTDGGKERTFSVRDNGLGIDPQYFDRIFVLFQRLHGREEFAGTGIGLAICKKILERLGGRIWVESQLKQGSTFRFALPEQGAAK
jgi:PAS domain S-box-containing protein